MPLVGRVRLDVDVVGQRAVRAIEEFDDAEPFVDGVEERPIALANGFEAPVRRLAARLLPLLGRFGRDEAGGILVLFAVAMGTIFGFMAVLIGGVVLFTVTNTMSMTVVERTVEIGTLRALGFRKSSVLLAFMVESLLLSLLGNAVLVPAVLFYLLLEWDDFMVALRGLVPPRLRAGSDSFLQKPTRCWASTCAGSCWS